MGESPGLGGNGGRTGILFVLLLLLLLLLLLFVAEGGRLLGGRLALLIGILVLLLLLLFVLESWVACNAADTIGCLAVVIKGVVVEALFLIVGEVEETEDPPVVLASCWVDFFLLGTRGSSSLSPFPLFSSNFLVVVVVLELVLSVFLLGERRI